MAKRSYLPKLYTGKKKSREPVPRRSSENPATKRFDGSLVRLNRLPILCDPSLNAGGVASEDTETAAERGNGGAKHRE